MLPIFCYITLYNILLLYAPKCKSLHLLLTLQSSKGLLWLTNSFNSSISCVCFAWCWTKCVFFCSTVPSGPPQNLTVEVQNSKVSFKCCNWTWAWSGIVLLWGLKAAMFVAAWKQPTQLNSLVYSVCSRFTKHTSAHADKQVNRSIACKPGLCWFSVWLAASDAHSPSWLRGSVNLHRSSHRQETLLSEGFSLWITLHLHRIWQRSLKLKSKMDVKKYYPGRYWHAWNDTRGVRLSEEALISWFTGEHNRYPVKTSLDLFWEVLVFLIPENLNATKWSQLSF